MTDKHTPGPWHVVTMRGWGGLCIGRRPQDEADKTAGDAPIAKVIEKAPHWQDTFPAEANARLIAAAPSLLEALEKVDKSWTESFPGGPDGDIAWLGGIGRLSEETVILWREIRAAISAARGEG